jgi:hypothetical protein
MVLVTVRAGMRGGIVWTMPGVGVIGIRWMARWRRDGVAVLAVLGSIVGPRRAGAGRGGTVRVWVIVVMRGRVPVGRLWRTIRREPHVGGRLMVPLRIRGAR